MIPIPEVQKLFKVESLESLTLAINKPVHTLSLFKSPLLFI